MGKPVLFDDSKYYRHNEPDTYEAMLKLTDQEIDVLSAEFIRKYDRLVDEFENKTNSRNWFCLSWCLLPYCRFSDGQ